MSYLLDTHTLIWALTDIGQIPGKTKEIIEKVENNIFISVVSFWEISIKYSIGKLELEGIASEDFPRLAIKNQFTILPLKPEEASTSYQLPWMNTHKDPFDRILIWQALENNFAIITKDTDFNLYKQFGLKLIW
ncbi:MAG: type II toxin-antitoxin system VapC family toxin [Flammeovirgaceae bacterium]|nr:type II toxin-antitoxin system VapC family toxin [Flammeovirgaceae bacterium]